MGLSFIESPFCCMVSAGRWKSDKKVPLQKGKHNGKQVAQYLFFKPCQKRKGMDWGAVFWVQRAWETPYLTEQRDWDLVWVLQQSCTPTSPWHSCVDLAHWRNMLSCAQSQQKLKSLPRAMDLWNKIASMPEQHYRLSKHDTIQDHCLSMSLFFHLLPCRTTFISQVKTAYWKQDLFLSSQFWIILSGPNF